MAPSPCSNPTELVGRRLYELLAQPQEPFLMEVYLVQNGCSGRIVRSQSSPFSCKTLRKLRIHGGIRRSRVTRFLRRVIASFVHRKALHLDRKTTTANKRSTIFDLFLVESKCHFNPLPILQLQHSDDESYPSGKPNECPLPSVNLKETHEKSMCHSRRRRLLFDCLRESEEGRIWNLQGCLDSELFEESMNELIFSRIREKWNQFKPDDAREIGLSLQSAILDDLMEESILDIMMNSNFH